MELLVLFLRASKARAIHGNSTSFSTISRKENYRMQWKHLPPRAAALNGHNNLAPKVGKTPQSPTRRRKEVQGEGPPPPPPQPPQAPRGEARLFGRRFAPHFRPQNVCDSPRNCPKTQEALPAVFYRGIAPPPQHPTSPRLANRTTGPICPAT